MVTVVEIRETEHCLTLYHYHLKLAKEKYNYSHQLPILGTYLCTILPIGT